MQAVIDFWAVVAYYPLLAVMVIALFGVAVIGGLLLCWVVVSRLKRVVRETAAGKVTIEFNDG